MNNTPFLKETSKQKKRNNSNRNVIITCVNINETRFTNNKVNCNKYKFYLEISFWLSFFGCTSNLIFFADNFDALGFFSCWCWLYDYDGFHDDDSDVRQATKQTQQAILWRCLLRRQYQRVGDLKSTILINDTWFKGRNQN